MLTRLYLIRHGETEWSLSGQHTSHTDIPLTAHGEDEARVLAQRLRDVPFDHVLTSPRQRARLTCELAGLGSAAGIEPDLMEWDYGDYEGRTPSAIHADRPAWNLFRDGAPNGESPSQISLRVDRLMAHLRKLDGSIAIFTHGHLGRVLAARWIGLSVEQAQHFLLSTASLGILSYEHGRIDQPAIELWNTTAIDSYQRPPDNDALMKRRAIDRWENEGGEIPQ